MLELQANSWPRLSVGGFCLISSIRMGIHPLGKAPPSTTAQRSPHPCSSGHSFFHRLRAVGERLAACTRVMVYKGHCKMNICTGGATVRSLHPPILDGAYRSLATATARGQAAIAIKMLTSRKFGMPLLPSINQSSGGLTD